MKKLITILIVGLLALSVSAQTASVTNDPNDPSKQIIELRVKTDAPPVAPKADAVETTKAITSEVVKGAQDLGTALGTGLRSLAYETRDITFGKDKTLVQGIDELSQTNAGKFTMAVIAWKVAGKDALSLMDRFTGVLVGVPILVVFFGTYVWVVRRFFMLRTVKLKETVTGEGKEKVKTITYGVVNADTNYNGKTDWTNVYSIDDQTRYGGMLILSIGWVVISAIIVGSVIF